MKNTPEYGTPVAVEIDGHAFFGVVIATLKTTDGDGDHLQVKVQIYSHDGGYEQQLVEIDRVLCDLGHADELLAAAIALKSYKWATVCASNLRGALEAPVPVAEAVAITNPPPPAVLLEKETEATARALRCTILADPTLAGAGCRFLVEGEAVGPFDEMALVSSFTNGRSGYWTMHAVWVGKASDYDVELVFRRPISAPATEPGPTASAAEDQPASPGETPVSLLQKKVVDDIPF